jgi:23S rRNA pseudouridine2605 synthase
MPKSGAKRSFRPAKGGSLSNTPVKRKRPTPGWAKTKTSESHNFSDDSRGPRLQKVLAEAGVGSRRACEELIESGAVRVNGHVVQSLPAWVDPIKDHITVSGKHIKPHETHVYVMLFKPRGVVSTNSDPEGRPRAIDLVQHPSGARVYPVGRLDMESSGLLLMTNDGELANRLTHPRHEVHKLYEIVVAGSLDESDVAKLENGLFLNEQRASKGRKPGSKTTEARLKLLKRDRDRTRLTMELGEGRNRQIRRMFAKLGYKVRKLRRVAMGPLKLKGLQPGQWRELTRDELMELKRAASLNTREGRAEQARAAKRRPVDARRNARSHRSR